MPTRPPGTPTVDLTFDDTFGTINDAVFMTGIFQSTPDHFSSFLAIKNNGTEQGYNTSGTHQFDTGATHSILLANVPIVVGDGSDGTVEGVAYREFRINIAEAGNAKQYLSLDSLQLWQEESGSLTSFTPGSGFAGAHTNHLAYNLDAGGDHWIGLKEPSNGNGANQTEFTVLIPDANFINDPEHRYITLYSKFGQQAGWEADSNSEEWGLNGASTGPTAAMTVHKTAAVPGDTANVVGEVISYTISVANVGDTALTGITVTDPSVSNLAPVLSSGFNSGDTNHDNKLSAGETWHYTASHTVTQNDLNTNGGGDGFIENTVTADSAQTTPVSATTFVVVESAASLTLAKMADVASVDSAGDVINYTVNVTNTGTVQLTSLDVTDTQVNNATPILGDPILGPPLWAQVLNGEFNVGDTNENGVQDPGETFQYVNAGDTNQNGVQDPGETFLFTNVGDTNQNGFQDTGETFQFYNAGDTNHNGVEDSGETFQFAVDHHATAVDADHNGLNDGDTNNNNVFDPGETWKYTVSYTVTQNDIDNGGVVNPALTHDNTATATTFEGVNGSGSVSVAVVQNPHVTLVKSATVADGSANAAGDIINYTITLTNAGNMTLTGVTVTDSPVLNLTFVGGDTDGDNKLDLTETWTYTASHIITQDEIDNGGVVATPGTLTINNTATVKTAQSEQDPGGDPDATASASASVPIVQDPHVTLAKSATVADGTANAAGDIINYTIHVANAGNMTLTGISVTDPSVTGLAYVSGDADNDGKLDLTETWTYTANHTVTQADIDNGGVVNALLAYNNTASVTTAQGVADPDANASASASVPIVQDPHVTLDKTAIVPGGTADTAGEVISYTIDVANAGNMTLTGVTVSDPSVADLAAVMSGGFNSGDTNQDGNLSLGETWHYTASQPVTQSDIDTNGGGDGTIDNTASVSTAQGASANDTTHVTVVQPPPAFPLTIDDNDHLSMLVDTGPTGPDAGGDLIQFFFQVANHTNGTFTSVTVTDTQGDAVPGSLQTPIPSSLGPLAGFNDTFNHFLTATDISNGYVDDDVTVSGVDPSTAVQMATLHYHFSLV